VAAYHRRPESHQDGRCADRDERRGAHRDRHHGGEEGDLEDRGEEGRQRDPDQCRPGEPDGVQAADQAEAGQQEKATGKHPHGGHRQHAQVLAAYQE